MEHSHDTEAVANLKIISAILKSNLHPKMLTELC